MARFTDKKGKEIIEGSKIKRYNIVYKVKEVEGKLCYFIGDVHYGWVNIGSNEDFEEVSN
tara:strand:- start:18639 stop:18818 length:180 start_codon:yes stop_codon:yes gene_type:complete